MPEHLRALVVILALATAVFAVAKAPACSFACAPENFERRRNLWFAVTLAAFFAPDFWVCMVAVSAMLLLSLRRETNRVALFFLVLFAVPPISAQIGGLGIIEHLFVIHYVRLLALALLLPAAIALWRQPDAEPFGRSLPDRLVAGYALLGFVLQLPVDSFTNALRHGLFYAFVDILLPYYVASRSLRNLQAFREALMAFLIAALVLCAIGFFELAKYWLLYTPLQDALDMRGTFAAYLERGQGSLRAQASTGHPIALGYVVAVAMGLFCYLQNWLSPLMRCATALALLAGLVAPLSRGPWVGAAVIVLAFIATGPSALPRLGKLALLALCALPLLFVTDAGRAVVDLLPFVGTVEAGTITYRQRLLDVSLVLIKENPFFGSADYLLSPAMQQLREGGIIDIVNTYVGIVLESGLVGLALFLAFFIAVGIAVLRTMRQAIRGGAARDAEAALLGRALLATLLGILVTIFTVSSISVIPAIYWSLAGVGAAYARLLAPARAATRAGALIPRTA